MHKSESFIENETHTILCNFEIQTDLLILAKKPDVVLLNIYDRVRKVVHGKLCKWFHFDDATKCYMHKSESFMENEAHKILCNFKIQTDLLILAKRPDLVLLNIYDQLTAE